MKFVLQKPYIYILVVVFAIYVSLAVWLSDFYTVFFIALEYAETVSWTKLIISMLLSVIIAFLVAVNFCYVYRYYRVRKSCKKGSTLAGAGALGGLVVGVCPVCVGGLMQLIFLAFGISFSFAVLPFDGIEIQVAVGLLLGLNIWYMEKKSTNYKKKQSHTTMKGGTQ